MQVLKTLMPTVLVLSGLYWFRGQLGQQPQTASSQRSDSGLFTWQSLQSSSAQLSPQLSQIQSGTIVAVPSADSLTVQTGGKQVQLRLCGIDAPELTQPGGKQAQAALKQLFAHSKQQIQFVAVRQQGAYMIAEVSSVAADSATPALLVNQELVRVGSAQVYYPYVQECPHQQAIVQAETVARQQQSGLWATANQLRPWEYRRQQLAQQLGQQLAQQLAQESTQPPNLAKALAAIKPDYLRDGMQRTTVGIASWYGPMLHGKPTASGETFNQNDLTAAHSALPFDTRLQVTNLQNGRSVVVRINDYHPALDGSTIDLSQAAAKQIGAIEAGIVPVEMEILAGR